LLPTKSIVMFSLCGIVAGRHPGQVPNRVSCQRLRLSVS
jgi:hypothetical protein